MTGPIIVAGAYRVAMGYKEGTLDRVNIFYVSSGSPSTVSLSDMADVFDNHDNAFGKAMRTAGTTLNTITVTDVRAALQTQFVKAITPPRPGTDPNNPLPGNVTSTVSWRGQYIGRKERGRSYMVDTPAGSITGNETITGARQGGLASWGAALLSALLTAGSELLIAHVSTHTASSVLTVVVEAILDSMRRRLPGRGR